MAYIDLREMVRLEHTTLKAEHAEATLATTRMQMDADDAEQRGDRQSASDLRQVAHEVQVSANKRWHRSN